MAKGQSWFMWFWGSMAELNVVVQVATELLGGRLELGRLRLGPCSQLCQVGFATRLFQLRHRDRLHRVGMEGKKESTCNLKKKKRGIPVVVVVVVVFVCVCVLLSF